MKKSICTITPTRLEKGFLTQLDQKSIEGVEIQDVHFNKVKHDLLGSRYTTVLAETRFKFNAPHTFKVFPTEGLENLDEKSELVEIHFQEGPIKETGVNGVCNEDLIAMVIARLEGFQDSPYNCRDNEKAIEKLEEALMWLGKRTRGRINRGVEGTSVK